MDHGTKFFYSSKYQSFHDNLFYDLLFHKFKLFIMTQSQFSERPKRAWLSNVLRSLHETIKIMQACFVNVIFDRSFVHMCYLQNYSTLGTVHVP